VDYFDMSWGRTHEKAQPLSFGTVKSKLIRTLEAGHKDVKLADQEMQAIKCWIDLNCPLWPDYRHRLSRSQVAQTTP
jgi:maltooligosyltrehalose synthase